LSKPIIHIIGAGWAGLSAAVRACQFDFEVHLYESAPILGGRAATHFKNDLQFDHGQHVLIDAYSSTRELIALLGGQENQQFLRLGLALLDCKGEGFELPQDSRGFKFLRALIHNKKWRAMDKFFLLMASAYWLIKPTSRAILMGLLKGDLDTAEDMSVKDFFAPIPQRVLQDLIEPLCLSALNTNIDEASAKLFIRVLKDAFHNPPQSCEMLIPKVPLADLVPRPAQEWLTQRGAQIHLQKRIMSLEEFAPGDFVLVCTPPREAARLCQPLSKLWAQCAEALEFERICTVYLQAQASPEGQTLPHLIALNASEKGYAQFAIKMHIDAELNTAQTSIQLAFVTSAAPLLNNEQLIQLITQQAQEQLGLSDIKILKCVCDKQATFKAKFGLERPKPQVGHNVWAAGDYVSGPYPATLEGAVRSGQGAIDLIATRLGLSRPLNP
jgi:protoporphyrinogen oxidase